MLQKKWAIFSILLYFFVGMIFKEQLIKLHPYGNYIFDSLFILFFLIKESSQISFKGGLSKSSLLQYLIALILGFLVYKFAIISKISIPFDFKAQYILLFLLVIGPILEELVFRFALFHLFTSLFKFKFFVVILTALLFSLSHFIAFFILPTQLSNFVIYQTFYTFLIGLWWGFSYLRSRSLTVPIFLHIIFNLGFYLASQFSFIRI